MNKLRQIITYARTYGLRSVAFRLGYEARLRSGRFRRQFPAWAWEERPLSAWLRAGVPADPAAYQLYRRKAGAAKFFFTPRSQAGLSLPQPHQIIAQAEEIVAGRLTYFFHLKAEIGRVPDWFKNPFTGQQSFPRRHWTEIPDFDPAQGDIKFIWEPSRFAWAYPLARAYAVSRQEKYAEHFWRWLEDWLARNPPNQGPHYKCGQECAVRCLAVVFALHAFADADATTPERLARAVLLLAAHAERIEKNIAYARWQKNNHALSEANGLYTIGTLFPELKDAPRWQTLGKRVLEEEAARQIYADGAYIQHSMNYHRVMLQNYLWALRLGELNGDSFTAETKERVFRAVEFLYELQEERSGRVPNYGPNDGALILPLNSCDYRDYRPLVQAGWFLFKREKILAAGPWDEDLAWLFGPEAISAPTNAVPRRARAFDAGGYYTLRGRDSWAFFRCHRYRDRANQADMLHVDLWYQWVNVLRDSGTCAYFAEPPWDRFFISSPAHNVVQLDGREQMRKGPRFIWYDWARAEKTAFSAAGPRAWVAGQLLNFTKLPGRPVHRRSLCRLEHDVWLIIDDILGAGRHTVDQYWHIAGGGELSGQDNAYRLAFPECQLQFRFLDQAGGTTELCRGRETAAPAGWASEYYGERLPAWTLKRVVRGEAPFRLLTILAQENVNVTLALPYLRLHCPDGSGCEVELADLRSDNPLVQMRK